MKNRYASKWFPLARKRAPTKEDRPRRDEEEEDNDVAMMTEEDQEVDGGVGRDDLQESSSSGESSVAPGAFTVQDMNAFLQKDEDVREKYFKKHNTLQDRMVVIDAPHHQTIKSPNPKPQNPKSENPHLGPLTLHATRSQSGRKVGTSRRFLVQKLQRL